MGRHGAGLPVAGSISSMLSISCSGMRISEPLTVLMTSTVVLRERSWPARFAAAYDLSTHEPIACRSVTS